MPFDPFALAGLVCATLACLLVIILVLGQRQPEDTFPDWVR